MILCLTGSRKPIKNSPDKGSAYAKEWYGDTLSDYWTHESDLDEDLYAAPIKN